MSLYITTWYTPIYLPTYISAVSRLIFRLKQNVKTPPPPPPPPRLPPDSQSIMYYYFMRTRFPISPVIVGTSRAACEYIIICTYDLRVCTMRVCVPIETLSDHNAFGYIPLYGTKRRRRRFIVLSRIQKTLRLPFIRGLWFSRQRNFAGLPRDHRRLCVWIV